MSYNESMNQLKNKPVLSSAVRASRGFTLVEILIVLALIAIVVGLTLGNLGGLFSGGQEGTAKAWVRGTGSAYVTGYLGLHGRYPTTLEELENCDMAPVSKSDLMDPWGKRYVYQYPGTNNPKLFDLSTTTPDGKVIGTWDTN